MSLQNFLEEVKKRGSGKPLSPAQEEVADVARLIYDDIRGGSTRHWVKNAAVLFVKSIAPELSALEVRESVVIIEGIVLTVLSEMFSEGVLLKKEVIDKE